MRTSVLLALGLLLFEAQPMPAATVLFCPFESLEGWTVRAVGAAEAAIIEQTDGARQARLTSRRGTVFLTRRLPLAAVQGCRVTVASLVKSEDVVPGAQLTSTAKVHLAVETLRGIEHYGARLSGSSEWHREGFTADVATDAKRVVLNLGLEACSGGVLFDRLTVGNDRRGVHPLDLSSAANAGWEQLGLAAFPQGTIEWEGVPFEILDADQSDGGQCFRLRGVDHPDWPGSTASPIPAGTAATAIYILHGALGGRRTSETPCAIWSARFADGQDYGFSVFEGRQIGAIGQTEDLENWHVAWRSGDADGDRVTFGVTKWTVYSDAPVVSLSCRAYHGASPVVLAVTVLEEPPAPPSQSQRYDEMGDEWDINR